MQATTSAGDGQWSWNGRMRTSSETTDRPYSAARRRSTFAPNDEGPPERAFVLSHVVERVARAGGSCAAPPTRGGGGRPRRRGRAARCGSRGRGRRGGGARWCPKKSGSCVNLPCGVGGRTRRCGRPRDPDVAADGLGLDLDQRAVGGRLAGHVELGAGVAAQGVAVEVDARAAADRDYDVARDGLRGDVADGDRFVVLVAADRGDAALGRRLADLDLARGGVDGDVAADVSGLDVAARALHDQVAARVAHLDVARSGAHGDVPEGAAGGDVGRLRARLESGRAGAPDAARDAVAPEEEPDAEAASLRRDVDEERVAAEVDARGVDERLRLLVVRGELQLDASLERRVDDDLAGGDPEVERHRARGLEGLLHVFLPSSGRSRSGACRWCGSDCAPRWRARSRGRATRSWRRPRGPRPARRRS